MHACWELNNESGGGANNTEVFRRDWVVSLILKACHWTQASNLRPDMKFFTA